MTDEETIRTIEIAKADVEWNYPMEYQVAFDVAIECIKKQMPKKPKITIHNGYCPNCKNAFGKKYVEDAVIHPYWKRYCPVCGQAIDWSDNE